jgi:hypothetical protein
VTPLHTNSAAVTSQDGKLTTVKEISSSTHYATPKRRHALSFPTDGVAPNAFVGEMTVLAISWMSFGFRMPRFK